MKMPFVNRFALLFLVVCLRGATAQDPAIDSLMDSDPVLPAARIEIQFSPGLLPLWLESLDRAEVELRARAAITIVQAHERGMKGLSPAVEPLLRELKRDNQHTSVRLASAKALVALDAREKAADLHHAAESDLEVRELVEPALARWDYKPAHTTWLARLEKPPHGRGTVLAIQGLATVNETGATDRLRVLLFDRDVPPAVRVEAARGLGILRTKGGEADAARLSVDATSHGVSNRIAAASLLRNHSGEEATKQLLILARDLEPAVATLALARLIELDSNLVVPLLERVLASSDAKVRALGIETLFRHPSEPHIRDLGNRMQDADPKNRRRAREALKLLAAKAEWPSLIAREAMRALESKDWRALEQGALLAAEIDHKPAANRLVELLSGDRSEVVLSAAWGLRKLAVAETLPPIHEYLKEQYRNMLAKGMNGGRTNIAVDVLEQQISQLCQFIGQAKYQKAEPLFRQWIPLTLPAKGKGEPPPLNPIGLEPRAAAFWALGKFHEGQPVADLVRTFSARLRAILPPDVEATRVRVMAAVSLGRMKANDGLPTLREFFIDKKPTLNLVNNACGWAIEQIVGEKVPAAGTIERAYLDWFLMPLK
jgi:HEAT repeat protein